jgi:hypothetical protein
MHGALMQCALLGSAGSNACSNGCNRDPNSEAHALSSSHAVGMSRATQSIVG